MHKTGRWCTKETTQAVSLTCKRSPNLFGRALTSVSYVQPTRLVQLRTSKDGMIPLTCQLFKGIRKLSTKNVDHLCIKLSFVLDIQASVFIILLISLFITFPNNQRPMAKVKLWLSQKMTDLKSYHRLAVWTSQSEEQKWQSQVSQFDRFFVSGNRGMTILRNEGWREFCLGWQ